MRQAQNIFHLDSTGIYWVKGQTKTFPLQGKTHEFLNRPDVRAAAGLGKQKAGVGGVSQQGGDGVAEVRYRDSRGAILTWAGGGGR